MRAFLKILPLLTVCVLSACGENNSTRSTPSLEPLPPTAEGPPKKNFLQEAGDTTWRVVTSPARLVTPAKPPAPSKEPETFEPPNVLIVPTNPPQ